MLIHTLFASISKSSTAFIGNKQIPTVEIEPIAIKVGLSAGSYPLLYDFNFWIDIPTEYAGVALKLYSTIS